MSAPIKANWDAIEPHYRAGILSILALSRKHGVSRAAIEKHAERHGWTRSLAPKIKVAAERIVEKEAVVPPAELPPAEARKIISANAQAIAAVIQGHRSDIARARQLVRRLWEELDVVGVQADAIEDLAKAVAGENVIERAELLKAVNRVTSLTGRILGASKLATALTRVVELERVAYGLVDTPPAGGEEEKGPEQRVTEGVAQRMDRIAAKLRVVGAAA